MNKYKILVLLICFGFFYNLVAQTKTMMPKVGEEMPDFTFNKVVNYQKDEINNNVLKGKWTFLDFWTINCVSCIASFPKIDKLQKEFSEKTQFILVGRNDKHNPNIEKVYKGISKKHDMMVAAAFDSIYTKKWQIHSVPQIYVIDPNGVLKYITDGRDLTPAKIQNLIDGIDVSFYDKTRVPSNFIKNKLGYNTDDSSSKLIYRSLLSVWDGEAQKIGDHFKLFISLMQNDSIVKNDYLLELENVGWSTTMTPLYALYNYAYFGRYTWVPRDEHFFGEKYGQIATKPILEIADKSKFEYDFKEILGAGTYNYNLKIPLNELTVKNMMSYMQEDLKRVFKYDATIETRELPVYEFVFTGKNRNKFKTKGGDRFFTEGSTAIGFEWANCPSKYLSGSLYYLIDDNETPIIDKTGISGNIDFKIKADMTNLESIRKALQKQGLDIVKGTKEMKVLVIRDPKPEIAEQ
ncbi:MAG TPA: redoxin domain-containing protein [Flavobacteriaceae bacterium]